jgi:transketolase N-terminal domain/subunit
MKKELIKYSFKNKLAHIPSALSMIDYLQEVFKFVKRNDNIIIGKPFGAQAYYLIWKKLKWIENIEQLSMGVKHDEIDFVHFSEETIGNALGVAAGVAIATENLKNKTYVNLSDACLQMGNTLEAIQFIGKHQLNIFVTIDYNNSQVTGNCSDIIPIEPVFEFFKNNGWNIIIQDNESITENIKFCYNINGPSVLVIKTKKGNGFPQMEKNTKKWHYKKIESIEELDILYKEYNEKNIK